MERVTDQTRLAVIEEGRLCEMYIERPEAEEPVGNIYLGRVENVLPGMNAAFVDIGLDRNGFLAADDAPKAMGETFDAASTAQTRIDRLVRPGQSILVQVTKAPTGQKGARLSHLIMLTGRSMVLMPTHRRVGLSRKLTDNSDRDRLCALSESLSGKAGVGLIVRTAAMGCSREAFQREFDALLRLWEDISRRAALGTAPKLLYRGADLALKAVRDELKDRTENLWTDDPALFEHLKSTAQVFAPEYADRVRLHAGEVPLFDLYRVDDQADKALKKRVWLKSGGFLVIEPTEALTVIDVNTGKFTGGKAVEETLFQLNCEAADEILRQLRLRDVGGIIVIDFIDMDLEEHRQALLDRLREGAAADSNRVTVAGMSALGLVELTRKKVRKTLLQQLTHTCPICGGDGSVPSHEALARRIQRAIWRRRRSGDDGAMLVKASGAVVAWLCKLGASGLGQVYVCADDDLMDDEHHIAPLDPKQLPAGIRRLK